MTKRLLAGPRPSLYSPATLQERDFSLGCDWDSETESHWPVRGCVSVTELVTLHRVHTEVWRSSAKLRLEFNCIEYLNKETGRIWEVEAK